MAIKMARVCVCVCARVHAADCSGYLQLFGIHNALYTVDFCVFYVKCT